MRALIAQIRADMGGSKATLRYIARKKIPGVPHHAKAGNINNALMNEGTNGDFIVIFDCDMICRPEFLQAVLPHFYKMESEALVIDENVAMVQTPQSFTNVPEDDPLGQQYRYFYGPVLHGWDAVGSTPCCGTNVTFSRKALLSVGGFTYGSITEDFLTSMTLHSHGSVPLRLPPLLLLPCCWLAAGLPGLSGSRT
jgi:cellulose synthase (UDP-forming)